MNPGFALVIVFIVLIGLCSGSLIMIDNPALAALAWKVVKWGAVLMVSGWVLSKVFPYGDEEVTENRPLHPWKEELDQNTSFATPLKGGQVLMEAEGYKFLVRQDRRGNVSVQEVEVISKDRRGMNLKPIGPEVIPSGRNPKGASHEMGEYIKSTVNRRKGRY